MWKIFRLHITPPRPGQSHSESPPLASHSQGELSIGWTLFSELPLNSVDILLHIRHWRRNWSDASRKMSRNFKTIRPPSTDTQQSCVVRHWSKSMQAEPEMFFLIMHSSSSQSGTNVTHDAPWLLTVWLEKWMSYASIGEARSFNRGLVRSLLSNSTPPHYFLQPQLTQLDLETLKLKVYAPTPVSTLWCVKIMFFKQLRWENSYEANYYRFTKRLFHTGSLNTDS